MMECAKKKIVNGWTVNEGDGEVGEGEEGVDLRNKGWYSKWTGTVNGDEDCGEMEINWRCGYKMWCGKFNVAISEAKYRCEKCVVNCGYEG